MKFHKWIKRMRLAAGLTQWDVAETFGYKSPQFVSNWERGLAMPPIRSIYRLEKLYKLKRDSIMDQVLLVKYHKLKRIVKRG